MVGHRREVPDRPSRTNAEISGLFNEGAAQERESGRSKTAQEIEAFLAEPLNHRYGNFIAEMEEFFSQNQRLPQMLNLLDELVNAFDDMIENIMNIDGANENQLDEIFEQSGQAIEILLNPFPENENVRRLCEDTLNELKNAKDPILHKLQQNQPGAPNQ